MILRIKNMVCNRCIMTVESRLTALGFKPTIVELGEAHLRVEPTPADLERISESLSQVGFELLDDKRHQLIEQIKIAVIQLAQQPELLPSHQNLSNYLQEKFGLHYTYISNLFTGTEAISLKQFFILQKMEKVKEWLTYDEMKLNEIADKLNYSTIQYLSKQFKKVTGFTPTQFKKLHRHTRKPLEEIND